MKELKTVWLDKNLLMVKPQSNSTLERLVCYLKIASSFAGSEQLFHKTLYKNYFIKMKFRHHSRAQSEQLKHKNKVEICSKATMKAAERRQLTTRYPPFFPPTPSHSHKLNALKYFPKNFARVITNIQLLFPPFSCSF